MKTNIKFDDKIKVAEIIVHEDAVDTFYSFIKKIGGNIVDTYTPELRNDDNYAFFVNDVSFSKLFPMPTGMVCALVLSKENITVKIHFANNGHADSAYIEALLTSKKSKEICTVTGKRNILEKHPHEYLINWSAWGSQPTEISKMFAEGMQIAVQLCEEFTEQYCINKVQTN